jgi:hypothetical protein
MRFANIRLGLIPEMPVVAIDSTKEVEKELQGSTSIFQTKSIQKLGKHTRLLVSQSLASFNEVVAPTANTEKDLTRGMQKEKERSIAMLPARSPISRSLRSLPLQHSSPLQWMAAQGQSSSDDES